MRDIRWTNQALLALTSLTNREQRLLFDRLELASQFPAMYPARQRGRFARLRYFVIGARWLVYYRVDESGILRVIGIVPALARPR